MPHGVLMPHFDICRPCEMRTDRWIEDRNADFDRETNTRHQLT